MMLVAGAACLFAGIAQAETPAAPDFEDPGYVNGGHFSGWTESQREAEAKLNQKEAAAPAEAQAKAVTASKKEQDNSEQAAR
jgi:hypothetical protein